MHIDKKQGKKGVEFQMKNLAAGVINALSSCPCFIVLILSICTKAGNWVYLILGAFSLANLILSAVNFKCYTEGVVE